MRKRILIRGVNWLGDAVMTIPALLRIRERFPEAHIALLSPKKLASLWEDQPFVNQTLTFESGQSPWKTASGIRAGRFDTAIILPNSPRSALESWLARVPCRIGYARPWRNWALSTAVPRRANDTPMVKRSDSDVQRRVQALSGAATHADEIPAEAHHLFHYLNLARAVGADPSPLAPRLLVAPEILRTVRRRFGLGENPREMLLGLNPGAEYGPAKRWPPDRFIETAVEVGRRAPVPIRWLLFGGGADVRLTDAIASAIRTAGTRRGIGIAAVNLAGTTSLRELAAAMSLCSLVLTNDTGPMHVAAAVGARVVVPFGSTSPALTAPGFPGEDRHVFLNAGAPCSPCFRRDCPIDLRCLTGISVEQVTRTILERLPGDPDTAENP